MQHSRRVFCGSLTPEDAGRRVTLAGWVDAFRDHGGVLFVHLRDRSGIVQIVFNPESTPDGVFHRASLLRAEYCIAVQGRVDRRLPGTENPGIETGSIEVFVDELEILSESEALPFTVSEKAMTASGAGAKTDHVAEDLRLQYRYLDLRRPSMRDNIMARHTIFQRLRRLLDGKGFLEIETPVLTISTPEGARDYLVPSRVHPGNFYALPQSPQLFKQLLMIGGMERYFQFARCFRDEDLRPNRQPEFTQLDIEASFIDEEFIYQLVEELAVEMFALGGITLPRPFPRMSWNEAMEKTGSDRPDLRFGLLFEDVTSIFADTGYSIFRRILQGGGRIKGINIAGQSEKLSKNVLQNEYAKEIAPSFGARGMTWMRMEGGKLESNIVQFMSPREREGLVRQFRAVDGDVLIMVADTSPAVLASALGQLRLHLANRLGLIPADLYRPLWVTDFPLFEPAEGGGVTSSHHPFTAPDRTDFDPADRDELLTLRSRSYDLVMNGEELGGGSIRISDRNLQRRIFTALGLTEEEIQAKFGFFLRAFDFGAPPHGGIALGMDRTVSMILNTPSIREVIAFPKNRSAYCPLTGAPSTVRREQLAELGLLGAGKKEVLPGPADGEDEVERLSWVSRIRVLPGERREIEETLRRAEALARQAEERAGDEEPVFSPAPAANRLRDGGEARTPDPAAAEKLLKLSPSVKGNYYKVPGILD